MVLTVPTWSEPALERKHHWKQSSRSMIVISKIDIPLIGM